MKLRSGDVVTIPDIPGVWIVGRVSGTSVRVERPDDETGEMILSDWFTKDEYQSWAVK